MTYYILSVAGVVVGGIIGLAFGAVQNAAALRNEKRQDAGKLRSGWAVMPGSMSRVALFMIILLFVQIGMPMLFAGEIQWMVSAGVILGYAWMSYLQFRRRLSKTFINI